MNVDIYDFDKTVVPFDSGSLFWGYCLLHYPWILIFLPIQFAATLLVGLGIISFTHYKKVCFVFVPVIPLEKAVKGFWNRHEKQVFSWFKNRPREAVVISASPDFLLCEIQERLGFEHLICTRHNRKTGAIIGLNCRDEEKVRRFRECFPKAVVHDVYSDSLRHDRPIFSLANDNCYHIVNSNRVKFKYKDKFNGK